MLSELPDYLIFRSKNEDSSVEVRKINGGDEVGISATEGLYQFPFTRRAEGFINKKDAERLIKALQDYFKI